MEKPFVISLSSISDGGKTTVANMLKNRLENAKVISFDDYDDINLARDINEWSSDTNDENEWCIDSFAADVEKFLNEPHSFIILDYPFGYRNEKIGKHINFAIFIDTPLDVALAQRIIRDYTNQNTQDNFGFADVEEVSLASLNKELNFYLSHSRPTYKRMAERQKPYSDLVDGTKTPGEIVDEIINILNVRTPALYLNSISS